MKFWGPLLLASASLLAVSSVYAEGCNKAERKPQTASTPFKKEGSKSLTEQFQEHEKKQLERNKEIPKVCVNSIRLVTYDLAELSYLANGVASDLEKLNPTVVAIQDVKRKLEKATDDTKETEFPIKEHLEKLGLKYQRRIIANGSNSGFLLASKLPFEMVEEKTMQKESFESRDKSTTASAMMVGIKVNEQKIAIVGVDLADSKHDTMQKSQAEEVLKLIKDKIPKDYDKYVVMGGFNAIAKSETMKVFGKAGLEDSFAALKWPSPVYTSYSGTTTDFIMVSKAIKENLLGSYFAHTSNGVHLPIMVDIKAPGASKAIAEASGEDKVEAPFYSFSRYGWHLLIGGAFLLIVVAALLMVSFRRRSSSF